MPLYFFNVYDGVNTLDVEGTDLPDINTARIQDVILAGDLMRDYADSIAKGEDWHLEVTDRAGLVLFHLDIQATEAPVSRTDLSTRL